MVGIRKNGKNPPHDKMGRLCFFAVFVPDDRDAVAHGSPAVPSPQSRTGFRDVSAAKLSAFTVFSLDRVGLGFQ